MERARLRPCLPRATAGADTFRPIRDRPPDTTAVVRAGAPACHSRRAPLGESSRQRRRRGSPPVFAAHGAKGFSRCWLGNRRRRGPVNQFGEAGRPLLGEPKKHAVGKVDPLKRAKKDMVLGCVPQERNMASQSQPVRRLRQFKPGHLVTDQDLNLFVEAIKDLDRRLAALEAAFQKLSPGRR